MNKLNSTPSFILPNFTLQGLLMLFLLDLTARALFSICPQYWPVKPYDSPNRSNVWWTTQAYIKRASAPDIVLMGSSLMTAAVYNADANYLQKPINISLKHDCSYLQTQLAKEGLINCRTFCFGIPGQMASDAYCIATTLFQDKLKPKNVVWGIAPRDFIDSTFGDPASSESYKLMNHINCLKDPELSKRSSVWDKVDHFFERLSFLYEHRQDFVLLQHRFMYVLLHCLHPKLPSPETISLPFALRKEAFILNPDDHGQYELLASPDTPKSLPTNNLAEYGRRYSHAKRSQFEGQLAYLDKLAKYLHAQGIQLTVVNMPITSANVDLLSGSFYKEYRQRTMKIVSQNHAQYYDLNHYGFPSSCFGDSVHLNGSGGIKFTQILAPLLVHQSQIAGSTSNSIQ